MEWYVNLFGQVRVFFIIIFKSKTVTNSKYPHETFSIGKLSIKMNKIYYKLYFDI